MSHEVSLILQAAQVFETMEPVFDKRPEFLPVMVRSLHGMRRPLLYMMLHLGGSLRSFNSSAQPAARCHGMPSLLQTHASALRAPLECLFRRAWWSRSA